MYVFIFCSLHPSGRHTSVPDLRKGVGPAVVPLVTACGLGRECPHCSAVAGEGDGRTLTVHHREKEDVSVLIGCGELEAAEEGLMKDAVARIITLEESKICHFQAVAGRDAQAGAAVGEGERPILGIALGGIQFPKPPSPGWRRRFRESG